jgi:hypothetical protein
VLYSEDRFYGFCPMNILVDMLILSYDHYNIIHWRPNIDVVNSHRYPITEIVQHGALKAYSVSDSVVVSTVMSVYLISMYILCINSSRYT